MLFHLFVVNQKGLCVRSCLMANPDLQLLFSHTYFSFSAHPRTQSRCRCHDRPESLLPSASRCYAARSLGLASGKANQPNKKSCLLLTSDDLKPVYWLKRQKERMWGHQLSAAVLLGSVGDFGERFWERRIAAENAQYFSYFWVPSFQECSKKQQCWDLTRNKQYFLF